MSARGEAYFDPERLLPPDAPLPADRPIHWLEGRSWPSGAPIWIPLDAVSLGGDAPDLPAIGRSTNGLASGNCSDEALFHAICELVERDGVKYLLVTKVADDKGVINLTHEEYGVQPFGN